MKSPYDRALLISVIHTRIRLDLFLIATSETLIWIASRLLLIDYNFDRVRTQLVPSHFKILEDCLLQIFPILFSDWSDQNFISFRKIFAPLKIATILNLQFQSHEIFCMKNTLAFSDPAFQIKHRIVYCTTQGRT